MLASKRLRPRPSKRNRATSTRAGHLARLGLALAALALLLTPLASARPAGTGNESLDGLGAWIEELMGARNVPGTAVAVVRDGAVIWSGGFGHRDVAAELPVTEQTLFAIGSTSKAFTAMAIAMLVEDEKLDWDTPVREYLPSFRLHDPVASAQMTPRDLVTHRSGLPRHDLVWYGAEATREELVSRIRYLEPTAPFRARWQYQNLMFMTAGYLVGQVNGGTWEQFVRARILDPLEMTGSNFSVEESKSASDHALPYSYDREEERLEAIPFRNIDAVGPAGSINSSVGEMSQWILLHLNEGKRGETQIVSAEQVRQMHAPQMVMPTGEPSPVDEGMVFNSTYGLGWVVQTYRGHRRVSHGGGIDGFTTQVALLPDQEIGAIAVSNLGGTPVPEIIVREIFDRLLELEPVDWNDRIRREDERGRERARERREKMRAERRTGTSPSHAIAEYAGTYVHPGYGEVTVSVDGDALAFRLNGISGPLEHWHYDVFNISEGDGQGTRVTFTAGETGMIQRASARLEPAGDPIVFERKAEEAATAGSRQGDVEGP